MLKFLLTRSIKKSPIFIGLFLLYFTAAPLLANDKNAALTSFSQFDTDPVYGTDDANFVFIEYADYHCQYCQQFHHTLTKWFSPAYQRTLNSDQSVKWVYRHFPIFGEKSIIKAKTAICVLEQFGQDSFWQFNDVLFTQPISPSKQLNYQQSVWLIATKQGWDVKKLIQCDAAQTYQAKLESLANQAKFLNLAATPSWYFLNIKTGKVLTGSGTLTLSQLDALLTQ